MGVMMITPDSKIVEWVLTPRSLFTPVKPKPPPSADLFLRARPVSKLCHQHQNRHCVRTGIPAPSDHAAHAACDGAIHANTIVIAGLSADCDAFLPRTA